MERHLGFFDARIREVLRVYGVRYEPDATYYNTVFFYVYERAFQPDKLSSYDLAKGEFRPWLSRVIRNAVLDWIKSSHPDWPVSWGLEAGRETARVRAMLSLDNSDDDSGEPDARLAEKIPDPKAFRYPEETAGKDGNEASNESAVGGDDARIENSLAAMPDEQRAAFELYSVNLRSPSQWVRDWLMAQRSWTREQTETEIAALADGAGGQLESEKLETELAICNEMERGYAWQTEQAESRLAEIGWPQATIEEIEQEAMRTGFAELERKKKLNAKDRDTLRAPIALVECQIAYKRWRKWAERRSAALDAYREAAHIRFPSYREIGRLIGKSESAMAGLLRRAKDSFRARLA